jgi:hypothetical protein
LNTQMNPPNDLLKTKRISGNQETKVLCQLRSHKYKGNRVPIFRGLAYCIFCGIRFSKAKLCFVCERSPVGNDGCKGCQHYLYMYYERCTVCKNLKPNSITAYCANCQQTYTPKHIRWFLELKVGLRFVQTLHSK